MEQIKRFRVPLIGVLAALVVVAIAWGAWISPQGAKAASLAQQKTQALTEEDSLQTQLATLKEEQRDVNANCATLARDLTMIPTTPEASQFLTQVTQLAQSSGDPNTPNYSIGSATTKAPGGVSAVDVTLSLTGTFGQMSKFLQGLSSFPRLFTISSISMTGGPVIAGGGLASSSSPNYTLAMTGSIYYAPAGQANICSATGSAAAA